MLRWLIGVLLRTDKKKQDKIDFSVLFPSYMLVQLRSKYKFSSKQLFSIQSINTSFGVFKQGLFSVLPTL